jgi:hypothetical protein
VIAGRAACILFEEATVAFGLLAGIEVAAREPPVYRLRLHSREIASLLAGSERQLTTPGKDFG